MMRSRSYPVLTPAGALDCLPRGQDGRTGAELVADTRTRHAMPILAAGAANEHGDDLARENLS